MDVNNQYEGFPAVMNDARSLVTLPLLEADVHRQECQRLGLRSNFDYRQYLQQHGRALLEAQQPPRVTHVVAKDEIVSSSDLKQLYLDRERLQLQKFAPRYDAR